MNAVMEPWAQRLHQCMVEAGESQAALARACGIKPGSVSGWFGQGKPTKMISGDNLVACCTFLAVSPAYIMTGKGGRAAESQPTRFDESTMTQAVEFIYHMAEARPDDPRFRRFTWPMLLLAAETVTRAAAGKRKEAVADFLDRLAEV